MNKAKKKARRKPRAPKAPQPVTVENHRHPKPPDERPEFMSSGDARALRILAEYLEPWTRLRREGVHSTVVFFGSSRILPPDIARDQWQRIKGRLEKSKQKNRPRLVEKLKVARRSVEMSGYYQEARELARRLTQWSLSTSKDSGWFVVGSGGGPGIMEAANRGAREAGGRSIGFNISLPDAQPSNEHVTPELNFMFRYFFMRKLWFAQPAKALIVFPGGFGTMDELWEMMTLMQTCKVSQRVMILLYGSKFWKRAVNFNHLLQCGTVTEHDVSLLHFVDSPDEAFQVLRRSLRKERIPWTEV